MEILKETRIYGSIEIIYQSLGNRTLQYVTIPYGCNFLARMSQKLCHVLVYGSELLIGQGLIRTVYDMQAEIRLFNSISFSWQIVA